MSEHGRGGMRQVSEKMRCVGGARGDVAQTHVLLAAVMRLCKKPSQK